MTTIYEHAGKKYRLADQRDIGKEVYFDDLGFDTAMGGRNYPIVKGILAGIKQGEFRPFISTADVTWALAYVELTKEEPQDLYTERQAAWVAENDVKPGTKVRVTRTAESYEDGWGDSWLTDMDKYVGKTLEVDMPVETSVHLLTGDDMHSWNFPYFVLEVVKEPQWRLMGPEEIIDGECRYTNFEEDAEEPLDVFCGGWISLAKCPQDHGKRVKDASTFSKLYATQRPLPAVKAEVPPPPEGYEVVPESEYASYVPQRGDYFLGGMSNTWIPITCYDSYTCADFRNQWDHANQLYAGFARRIPVVAERLKVEEKPDLWRLLGDDEIIQKGDLVNSTFNKWQPESLKLENPRAVDTDGWISASGIGKPASYFKNALWVIRRIDAEPKHQPKPTYQEMVKGLVKPGKLIASEMTAKDAHLMHMVIGVSGEAGELLDAVKKAVIYRKALDRVNVVEELGDLEFYMEGLRQGLGITREECLKANMEKLSVRYGQKYSDQAATVRADKEQS